MATAPSISPFFPAPYTLPDTIPTQIETNCSLAGPTPTHGDPHHTSFPFFPTTHPYSYTPPAPVYSSYPAPPPGFVPAPAYAFPPPSPYNYHYPHPAAAYPAPPPGFFPGPPNLVPFPTNCYHPPLPNSPNWPPPAPESTSPPTTAPPATGAQATALPRWPDQVPGDPLSTASQAVRASPTREHLRPPQATPPRPTSLDPSIPFPSAELSTSKVAFHAIASKMQAVPAPLRELPAPPTREPRSLQSRIATKPSANEGHRTREKSGAIGTDKESVGDSDIVLYPAKTDHTPSPKLRDQVKAVQRHATAARDSSAALGRPSLDCLHANVLGSSPEVTSTVLCQAEEPAIAETTVREHMPQSQNLFDSLQAELSKMRDRLASLATSMASSSLSSSTTAGSTTTWTYSSPVLSAPSMLPSAAIAYVAPQVFGEMPTPNFGNGSPIIAPRYENCCFGYSNPVQNSCVQGGSTNLSEQHIDELPQAYALHNLICRTVVRADGSEHSYYALPGNYPLEQDMPEPLLSNKSVDVSASTLEQQPDEEEQHADVQDCTIKLQQKDDESTCSCPVIKASNSSAKSSSKLSIVHGMSELRMLWDPGVSTFLYSSKAKPPRELSYVDVGFPKGPNLCNQVGTYVQHLRDLSWNLLVTHERQKEWDPGDTTLQVMFTTAVDATKWQCTEVYKSAIVQTLAVNFSAGRAPIFKYAIICTDALGLRCKQVNASVLFALAIQGPTGRSVAKPLLFLANDGNSSTNHSSPMLFMQLLCANTSIQVTELRHHLEFSLLFPFLKYMPQRTSMGSSQWISHVVIVLSCRFPSFEMAKLQWDPGIGIPSSLYLWMQGLTAGIATEKSLSWLPIPQLTKWQSKVASASFEWDPGTMLLQYKPKWWLLFIQEKISRHNNIKFYGIALWMINFQPP